MNVSARGVAAGAHSHSAVLLSPGTVDRFIAR
jgi:hypothetical protein